MTPLCAVLPARRVFTVFILICALLPAGLSFSSGDRREAIFFGHDVADASALMLSRKNGTFFSSFRLAEGEGFAAVTRLLSTSGGAFDAVHLISHGDNGAIRLGAEVVTLATLPDAEHELSQWRQWLAPGADLLVYGCNVAHGDEGRALLARLAALTGANVAASEGLTGHADQVRRCPARCADVFLLLNKGGDWRLEFSTGVLQTSLPFTAQSVGEWRHTLQLLTVKPISWDVIGLDSNNVNLGPNLFLVGVRVCSSGTSTNVKATFVWDPLSSASFINLSPGSPSLLPPVGAPALNLAAGQCFDFYFNVAVTRSSLAYFQARKYRIRVTADSQWVVQTPDGRQLYVEKILSQNRNTVQSFTGASSVLVGGTYTYVLLAKTAPGGYNSVENFPFFPAAVFQVLSITTTYTNPTGGTNNAIWADACGFDQIARGCVGPCNYAGCGAGGDIVSTYSVKILGLPSPAGPVVVSNLIYDLSGGSYHYNSDYGTGVNVLSITVSNAPSYSVSASKTFSATRINLGITATATIMVSNSGPLVSGFSFQDTFPAGLTLSSSPVGIVGTGCGTANLAAVPPNAPNTLTVAGVSLAAGSMATPTTCSYTVALTGTTAGEWINPPFDILSGSTVVGSAPQSVSVNVIGPPIATKVFGLSSTVGATVTQTFTITIVNNNAVAIGGIGFTDVLSPRVTTISGPAVACGGSVLYNQASPASSSSVVLSGGVLAAGSFCVIVATITVPSTPAQLYVNAPFSVQSTSPTLSFPTSALTTSQSFTTGALAISGMTGKRKIHVFFSWT